MNEADGASLPDTRKQWEMERREADKLWDKPGLCRGVLLTSFPVVFISKRRSHTFVQFIYNIMLVSGVEQSDSVRYMCVYVCCFSDSIVSYYKILSRVIVYLVYM